MSETPDYTHLTCAGFTTKRNGEPSRRCQSSTSFVGDRWRSVLCSRCASQSPGGGVVMGGWHCFETELTEADLVFHVGGPSPIRKP